VLNAHKYALLYTRFSSPFHFLKTCFKQFLDADGPVEVTPADIVIFPTIVKDAATEEHMIETETEIELEAIKDKDSGLESLFLSFPLFSLLLLFFSFPCLLQSESVTCSPGIWLNENITMRGGH